MKRSHKSNPKCSVSPAATSPSLCSAVLSTLLTAWAAFACVFARIPGDKKIPCTAILEPLTLSQCLLTDPVQNWVLGRKPIYLIKKPPE